MTYLKRLRIHNCCQYRDLDLEVGPGLTVLTGAMGSGKSNLLNLLLGSLSNDFGGLYGNKKLNVRRGAEKEPAFVQTTWLLPSGSEMEVTRYLQKGSSMLFVDHRDTEIRGEAQITARVSQLLECDVKQLREHCFVPQSQTSAILEQTATDRAEFWAGLLGAQWLLALHEPVARELSQVERLVSADVQQRLDECSRQIAQEEQDLAEVLRAIDHWRAQLLPEDEALQFRLAIQRAEQLENYRKQNQSLVQQTARLKARYHEEKDKLDAWQRSLQQASDQLQQALAQQTALLQNQRIDQLQEELAGLLAEVDELPPEPVPPAEPRPTTEALDAVRQQLAECAQRLKLQEAGRDQCSHCLQPIKLSESTTEKLRWQQEELTDELKRLRQLDDDWATYYQLCHNRNASIESLRRWQADRSIRIDKLSDQLVELGPKQDCELVPGAVDALSQEVRGLKQTIARFQQAVNLEELHRQLVTLQAKHTAVQQWLKENASVNFAANWRELLETHDRASEEIARLEQQKAHALGSLTARRQHLDKLELERRSQSALEGLRDALELSRKRLRPADIPSLVLAAAAGELIKKANLLCSQLALPMRLSLAEDFELMVQHDDGVEESVRRLSHGQRSCVAVALWLAKLLSADAGVDVLVLDEPSANMDATGVRMFAEMLLSIGEFLKNAKLQVWLTTHHQQLATCGQYHLHLG